MPRVMLETKQNESYMIEYCLDPSIILEQELFVSYDLALERADEILVSGETSKVRIYFLHSVAVVFPV